MIAQPLLGYAVTMDASDQFGDLMFYAPTGADQSAPEPQSQTSAYAIADLTDPVARLMTVLQPGQVMAGWMWLDVTRIAD